MAFDNLNTDEIQPGKPTKTELFRKTKDSLEDLDGRTTTVENAVSSFLELDFELYGDYSAFGTIDKAVVKRINFGIKIVAARLLILIAGTGGTTEIDLLYKRGAGAWTSLVTTRPSVGFGDGDYAISTNGVLDAGEVNLSAGDLLAMDLTGSQTGGLATPSGLIGILEYEKS